MSQPRHIAIAIEFNQPFANHVQLLDGIVRYVKSQPGWSYAIDEHPGYKTDQRPALSRPYDGVIARANAAAQRRLKQMGVPLVNVQYDQHRRHVAGVYTDLVAAGRMAAEHLIERGFRRLAAFLDLRYKYTAAMVRGFTERAEEDDVPHQIFDLTDAFVHDPKAWLSLEQQITRHMGELQSPTGAFVDAVGSARLLVQTALIRGWRVPQDLAVICNRENAPMLLISPQISALQYQYSQIGQEACRLLGRLMDGEPIPNEPTYIAPKQVIVRESTDFFAVQDEVVAAAIRHISLNLTERLRVDDIAYAINVSLRLLQKRFAEVLGVSISDEIRRLRIEKAKRLLNEPDRAIYSIPEEVGFSNYDAMNKIFHREVGMTPGEYRKQLIIQKKRD